MRYVGCWAVLIVLSGGALASAQTAGVLYDWSGSHPEDPTTTKQWKAWGVNVPGTGTNSATISAATGDLVVTERGALGGGVDGGTLWIFDDWNIPRENAPDKGNLDVTGLEWLEIDLKHNSPTGTINVDFMLHTLETESVNVFNPTLFPIAPGDFQTIRFPLNLLTPRQQASVKAIFVFPQEHAAVGNVTWTIREVRSAGAPLTQRDIVTNNLGTPDEGIDGAYPMNTSDMLAIVGNPGSVSQVGLSRNPAGSGSLQWTDRGGAGVEGDESGASIGWGNGAGWRYAQPGDPNSGNSYNERIADFSNYDRMTVRISALDAINPSGVVGIEGVFLVTDDDPVPPPTVLPSQNLLTDGQYHELVYDISSVPFLQTVLNWGLDVAPHPNNIVFNIDNIRLWNSTATAVPGDYDGDGDVTGTDFAVWRTQFGGAVPADPNADGDDDGDADGADFLLWQRNFGTVTQVAVQTTVPEPASAALACGLLLAASATRWRRAA